MPFSFVSLSCTLALLQSSFNFFVVLGCFQLISIRRHWNSKSEGEKKRQWFRSADARSHEWIDNVGVLEPSHLHMCLRLLRSKFALIKWASLSAARSPVLLQYYSSCASRNDTRTEIELSLDGEPPPRTREVKTTKFSAMWKCPFFSLSTSRNHCVGDFPIEIFHSTCSHRPFTFT